MSYNYKKIYNWPSERERFLYPWCYWDNAFTDEELSHIVNLFSQTPLDSGQTFGTISKEGQYENVDNREVRISDINFQYRNFQNEWIFERLNFVIESINNRFYNFDLNGYNSLQYTEYYGEKKGKYDFHQDVLMGDKVPDQMSEPRKLSVVMLLNEPGKDFCGGEFEINVSEEKKAETIPFFKGRIILFPSFILHRVKPVLSGVRKSLVAWVVGPKFR